MLRHHACILDLKDSDIERYLAEIRGVTEEKYVIPAIEQVQTSIKEGEIYRLGNHSLVCGDALNPKHVDLLLVRKLAWSSLIHRTM